MFIPEIPNNALSKHINTIVQLSIILANDFGKNAFKFDKPLSSEEIETWEKEHKITIPTSYKEWLQFSRASTILGNTAIFYQPDDFIIENDKKSFDVPDECVVIGELGGWGISICFHTETGEILYIDHGEKCCDLEFSDILDWVIERLEEKH